MTDQINIAEAKAKLSSLIERVERGETVTIARNNRPVATLQPIRPDKDTVMTQFQALRRRVNGPVRRKGESWRDFIHQGHRH